MTFAEATQTVLSGVQTSRIYRKAWDKDKYIRIFIDIENYPELINRRNPLIFKEDLEADDWEVVE
jgi:hypothetical protein